MQHVSLNPSPSFVSGLSSAQQHLLPLNDPRNSSDSSGSSGSASSTGSNNGGHSHTDSHSQTRLITHSHSQAVVDGETERRGERQALTLLFPRSSASRVSLFLLCVCASLSISLPLYFSSHSNEFSSLMNTLNAECQTSAELLLQQLLTVVSVLSATSALVASVSVSSLSEAQFNVFTSRLSSSSATSAMLFSSLLNPLNQSTSLVVVYDFPPSLNVIGVDLLSFPSFSSSLTSTLHNNTLSASDAQSSFLSSSGNAVLLSFPYFNTSANAVTGASVAVIDMPSVLLAAVTNTTTQQFFTLYEIDANGSMRTLGSSTSQSNASQPALSYSDSVFASIPFAGRFYSLQCIPTTSAVNSGYSSFPLAFTLALILAVLVMSLLLMCLFHLADVQLSVVNTRLSGERQKNELLHSQMKNLRDGDRAQQQSALSYFLDRLNNPLHMILSMLVYLQENRKTQHHMTDAHSQTISGVQHAISPSHATESEIIHAIKEQASMMSHILADAMDINKLESGMETVEYQPIYFPSLLSSVLLPLRITARDRVVTLVHEADEHVPVVYGDHKRVAQLLSCLLDSLIQLYEQEGTMTITITQVGKKLHEHKETEMITGTSVDDQDVVAQSGAAITAAVQPSPLLSPHRDVSAPILPSPPPVLPAHSLFPPLSSAAESLVSQSSASPSVATFLITVRAKGLGLNKAALIALLDPIYNQRVRHSQWGLGFTLVNRIVTALKGSVEIKGGTRGTTFTILLSFPTQSSAAVQSAGSDLLSPSAFTHPSSRSSSESASQDEYEVRLRAGLRGLEIEELRRSDSAPPRYIAETPTATNIGSAGTVIPAAPPTQPMLSSAVINIPDTSASGKPEDTTINQTVALYSNSSSSNEHADQRSSATNSVLRSSFSQPVSPPSSQSISSSSTSAGVSLHTPLPFGQRSVSDIVIPAHHSVTQQQQRGQQTHGLPSHSSLLTTSNQATPITSFIQAAQSQQQHQQHQLFTREMRMMAVQAQEARQKLRKEVGQGQTQQEDEMADLPPPNNNEPLSFLNASRRLLDPRSEATAPIDSQQSRSTSTSSTSEGITVESQPDIILRSSSAPVPTASPSIHSVMEQQLEAALIRAAQIHQAGVGTSQTTIPAAPVLPATPTSTSTFSNVEVPPSPPPVAFSVSVSGLPPSSPWSIRSQTSAVVRSSAAPYSSPGPTTFRSISGDADNNSSRVASSQVMPPNYALVSPHQSSNPSPSRQSISRHSGSTTSTQSSSVAVHPSPPSPSFHMSAVLQSQSHPTEKRRVSTSPDADEKQKVEEFKQRFSNLPLLVVDDSDINVKIAVRMLTGFECITAADGVEAVQQYKKRAGIDEQQQRATEFPSSTSSSSSSSRSTACPFSLILMDIHMPNLDGREATRIIRSLENLHRLPRIPIIAVTANCTPADRKAAAAAGLDLLLAKPFTKPQLFEVMTLALKQQTTKRERRNSSSETTRSSTHSPVLHSTSVSSTITSTPVSTATSSTSASLSSTVSTGRSLATSKD